MKIPRNTKEQESLVDNLSLDKLEREIRRLYKGKKYLNLIALYNVYSVSLHYAKLDPRYFSYIMSSLIYVALSYFSLEKYQKALILFQEIEIRHRGLIKMKHTLQRQENRNLLTEEEKKGLNGIKQALYEFNTTNRIKLYINFAYTFYKVKETNKKKRKISYEKALFYYHKALLLKRYMTCSQFIQSYVGIAEVKYCTYNNKKTIPEKLKTEFEKIKEIFIMQETSFDAYLALGKISYFMQEYDNALIYVQKALEFASKDEEKRIYAYDWMSRISYKNKQYSTASLFYEKIIDELVNYPDQQQEEIHSRPKLYKMVQFLNETKTYLAQEETSKLSKSIWAGIVVTSLFELINCYRNYKYSMLTCVLIGFGIFIFIYILLHTELRFTKCLNKHLPTYSKIVKWVFQKII